MANEQNLRPWKPGQSGNPRGPEKHVGALKKLTQAQVKTIMDLVLTNDVGAIERIKKDPKTPLLQAWICSIALKGFKTGDHSAIEVLLARSIGKLKDVVDVNTTVNVAVTKQSLSQAIKKDKFLDVEEAEYETLPNADNKNESLASEDAGNTGDNAGKPDLLQWRRDIEAAIKARANTLGAAEANVATEVADPLRVEVSSEPSQATEP